MRFGRRRRVLRLSEQEHRVLKAVVGDVGSEQWVLTRSRDPGSLPEWREARGVLMGLYGRLMKR